MLRVLRTSELSANRGWRGGKKDPACQKELLLQNTSLTGVDASLSLASEEANQRGLQGKLAQNSAESAVLGRDLWGKNGKDGRSRSQQSSLPGSYNAAAKRSMWDPPTFLNVKVYSRTKSCQSGSKGLPLMPLPDWLSLADARLSLMERKSLLYTHFEDHRRRPDIYKKRKTWSRRTKRSG